MLKKICNRPSCTQASNRRLKGHPLTLTHAHMQRSLLLRSLCCGWCCFFPFCFFLILPLFLFVLRMLLLFLVVVVVCLLCYLYLTPFPTLYFFLFFLYAHSTSPPFPSLVTLLNLNSKSKTLWESKIDFSSAEHIYLTHVLGVLGIFCLL